MDSTAHGLHMGDKQFYAVALPTNVGAVLNVTVDTFHPGTAPKMSAVEEEAIWCYCRCRYLMGRVPMHGKENLS